jgi:mRNA interferase YafQ
MTPVNEPFFDKDLKKLAKKHYPMNKVVDAVRLLAAGEPMPGKYHDPALTGNLAGFRECHLESNLLLMYRKDGDTLYLFRIGSHDELFK